MTEERNNLKNDNKKEKETAIFDAACRVIRQKGFHQARMADIAAEAGISYGLVYHYFDSKAGLFDTLIEEWWTGLDNMTLELLDAPLTVEEKLAAIADYYLDQYEKRPNLVHIFITELSRSTANLTPDRLDRFKRLMSRTEAIMAQAQEKGDIRDDVRPHLLTYIFLGAIEALLSTMVLEDQPIKGQKHRERLAQGILTVFFDGAKPRHP